MPSKKPETCGEFRGTAGKKAERRAGRAGGAGQRGQTDHRTRPSREAEERAGYLAGVTFTIDAGRSPWAWRWVSITASGVGASERHTTLPFASSTQ